MAGRIELRGQFVRSQHGLVKLLQIILGGILIYLVGWYCINGVCRTMGNWWVGPYWYQGLLSTTLFVTFIINIVQYILHLINFMTVCDGCSWRQFERLYAVIATVLLLIGMILETIALIDQGYWTAQLIIGEVLGWLVVLFFVIEAQLIQSGRVDGYTSI